MAGLRAWGELNRETWMDKKFSSLWTMVGNTPLIEILYSYTGSVSTIYAKCEHYNLTGSIKDRMALYILQKAYAEKRIKPDDRIVEASSGNTGISFAAIGRTLSTDLLKEEAVCPGYLTPDVELLDYMPVKRGRRNLNESIVKSLFC